MKLFFKLHKIVLDILCSLSYDRRAVANLAYRQKVKKEFEKISKNFLTSKAICDNIAKLCDERQAPGVQHILYLVN